MEITQYSLHTTTEINFLQNSIDNTADQLEFEILEKQSFEYNFLRIHSNLIKKKSDFCQAVHDSLERFE